MVSGAGKSALLYKCEQLAEGQDWKVVDITLDVLWPRPWTNGAPDRGIDRTWLVIAYLRDVFSEGKAEAIFALALDNGVFAQILFLVARCLKL